MKVITQKITILENVKIYIRREDLLHPYISGNKYRKLKYNIEEAKKQNKKVIATFGGAFSNHILATACAAKENGFQSIGIIRGEELSDKPLNETLQKADYFGMKFIFITRDEYREKNNFIEKFSQKEFQDIYWIPEGGTNALAIKGCEEILSEDDEQYDIICTCVGTGGTLSGLINSSSTSQKILGFSALEGNFLNDEVKKYVTKTNWEILNDYTFGGYAKWNSQLIDFINDFYEKYKIPLEPIYTGKMMFGIFDLFKKNKISKNARILVIHTGGIQGVKGVNTALKKKNSNEIVYE